MDIIVLMNVKPEDSANLQMVLDHALGQNVLTEEDIQKLKKSERNRKDYQNRKLKNAENAESADPTKEEEKKEEAVSPLMPSSLSSPRIPPINPITPYPSSQEERREEGKTKKGGRGELKPYGQFVRLSDDEYNRLVQDFGFDRVEQMIESMNNYIGEDETGKLARKYQTRNHNLTLRNWENRKAERQPTARVTNVPRQRESWIEVAERLAREEQKENEVIDL